LKEVGFINKAPPAKAGIDDIVVCHSDAATWSEVKGYTMRVEMCKAGQESYQNKK